MTDSQCEEFVPHGKGSVKKLPEKAKSKPKK
jgi:hypothetical protein